MWGILRGSHGTSSCATASTIRRGLHIRAYDILASRPANRRIQPSWLKSAEITQAFNTDVEKRRVVRKPFLEWRPSICSLLVAASMLVLLLGLNQFSLAAFSLFRSAGGFASTFANFFPIVRWANSCSEFPILAKLRGAKMCEWRARGVRTALQICEICAKGARGALQTRERCVAGVRKALQMCKMCAKVA